MRAQSKDVHMFSKFHFKFRSKFHLKMQFKFRLSSEKIPITLSFKLPTLGVASNDFVPMLASSLSGGDESASKIPCSHSLNPCLLGGVLEVYQTYIDGS